MVQVEKLEQQVFGKSAEEVLEFFLKEYGSKIALASSLGAEDQVLTDMLLKLDKKARIFTLDTGRLPYETYSLIDKTSMHYGFNFELFFPNNENVEKLVREKGINLFLESVEKRKECCYVRKVEPLKRALGELDVWITGLRAEQSVTRKELKVVEWDQDNGLIKLNPLLLWSEQDVWDYIKKNNVPYNKLHDQGYPSIGCAPCTRAIGQGEDIRNGRWWWENPEHKECGLHSKLPQRA